LAGDRDEALDPASVCGITVFRNSETRSSVFESCGLNFP